MRRLLLMLAVVMGATTAFATDGPLVVVGGGNTGPDIVAKVLELGGGRSAIIAVLPQASGEPDAGDSSVKMWLDAGAASAAKVAFTDRAAATAALTRATVIWIPGGDQDKFMKEIVGTGLDDVIRARHHAGAVVGGTSAGAAVLVASMFTGDADLKSITAATTVIAKGLGLWPEVLVDQHFLTRQRDNRLISAVLDQPTLVGVGIDESTAVVVHGSSFDVIGKSSVVVFDARTATVAATPGKHPSAVGMKMAVLHAGMSYSLGR